MCRLFFSFLILFATTLVHAREQILLEQLLNEKLNSPQQSISNSRLSIYKYSLSQAEADDDWKLFGSVGAARNSEVATEDDDRKYTGVGGTIGLSYPLFGTLETKENQVKRASSLIDIESHNYAKITYDNERAITINYINYWSSILKEIATNQFLTHEQQVLNKLKQRVDKGLLYRSDFHEFSSAFFLAKKHQKSHLLERKKSLNNIETLTGLIIGEFTPVKPEINNICHDPLTISTTIQQTNHELKQLEKEIKSILSQLENSRWSGVESDFSVKQSIGYETNPDGDTSSLSAAINVKMPLDIGKYNHSSRQILKYRLIEKRAEYDLRLNELEQLAFNQYQNMQTKKANLDFQLSRLRGTEDSTKRETLRFNMIDGDVVEKVVQAHIKQYVQLIDYIEALHQYLASRALANKELTKNCTITGNNNYEIPFSSLDIKKHQLNKSKKHNAKANKIINRESTSLYVWKSEDLFPKSQEDLSHLKLLNNQGINRLIVSLNALQIKKHTTNKLALVNFIDSAQSNNIQIELLLGEPTWIYPADRHKLLDILKLLDDLPFKGLHLDLELDQLDESKLTRDQQMVELVSTIKAVTRSTNLPVTLITHPRYSASSDDFCLFCELEKTSIHEISLMIYLNNYKSVAKKAEKIIKQYPGIKFSIAQSIEPEIDSANTYNHLNINQLSIEMAKLRSMLLQPNFNGIVIQSWSDFKELLP